MATWGIWLFVIGRRTLTSDLGENGVKTLVCMRPEVRMLFPEVKQLLRLLFVFPVTSGSAERSFSSLGRLETWLRTTMLQPRLSATAVFSVNQDLLDKINLEK
jgi:hypothetical protein